jgi:hypothetical protein
VKFGLGLAIGLVLGAGAMYLALEPPWRSAAPAPTEPVAAAPVDAGVADAGKGKKRRRGGAARPGGATVEREIDDEVVLTDADRRLEWRGDAVALPPRTYDLTSDAEARPLDDGEISAGVDAGASALIACVTQAIGSAPLTGEITVQLLVGGDGRVDKLRARAPAYLHERGLVPCLRRAARGLRFAATGAPTVVTAPFTVD